MPSVFYQVSQTMTHGLLWLCLSCGLLTAQISQALDETAAAKDKSSSTDAGVTTDQSDQAALLQQALLKIYRSNLLKKTYQHVEYPESSIERHEEGDVILLVEVRRDGKVKRIDYEAKASSRALNIAARTAVKKAHPFSEAPVGLDGDSFEIAMPIRFRLTE